MNNSKAAFHKPVVFCLWSALSLRFGSNLKQNGSEFL
jgi:hypothetical protein